MPVIAAINGPCYGWGLESALACDIRLTTKGATLCFPEARLGIFPGAGGLARLTKVVAHHTASSPHAPTTTTTTTTAVTDPDPDPNPDPNPD